MNRQMRRVQKKAEEKQWKERDQLKAERLTKRQIFLSVEARLRNLTRVPLGPLCKRARNWPFCWYFCFGVNICNCFTNSCTHHRH